jgi:hypothetical protein
VVAVQARRRAGFMRRDHASGRRFPPTNCGGRFLVARKRGETAIHPFSR